MADALKAALYLFVVFLYFTGGEALLCYRCDSQYSEDCLYYPVPLSSYEDCDDKPQRTYLEYKGSTWVGEKRNGEQPTQQPIYIRYRYKLCPLMEKTIKQYVSFAKFCVQQNDTREGPFRMPSPMDGVNYVCGKAVTHGPNGKRIRRGCTPDLFLNGTNACVSHSPHSFGAVDVACFCTEDFCNKGSPSRFYYKSSWSYLCLLPLGVSYRYFLGLL